MAARVSPLRASVDRARRPTAALTRVDGRSAYPKPLQVSRAAAMPPPAFHPEFPYSFRSGDDAPSACADVALRKKKGRSETPERVYDRNRSVDATFVDATQRC